MAILPHVETSLPADEIMKLLASASEYKVVASEGLPFEQNRYPAKLGVDGWCIVPVSLEDNVRALHEMLYPGEEYTPSERVREISTHISDHCAPYMQ